MTVETINYYFKHFYASTSNRVRKRKKEIEKSQIAWKCEQYITSMLNERKKNNKWHAMAWHGLAQYMYVTVTLSIPFKSNISSHKKGKIIKCTRKEAAHFKNVFQICGGQKKNRTWTQIHVGWLAGTFGLIQYTKQRIEWEK